MCSFLCANNRKRNYHKIIEQITRRQALADGTLLAFLMHAHGQESPSPPDENNILVEECFEELERWRPTMESMRAMSAQGIYAIIQNNPGVRFLQWQGAKIMRERGIAPYAVPLTDEQWKDILRIEKEGMYAITPETKRWLEEKNKRRKLLQELLSGY